MKLDKSVRYALALVGQFGFSMLVPIFLLFWLGLRLDRWLGTNFLVIIFFFAGALVGMWNVYALVKRLDRPQEGAKEERIPEDDGPEP